MVVTMWVLIAFMGWMQYKSIVDFNAARANRLMLSATSDILGYYERNASPRTYLTSLNEFSSGTILESMRLSVYERDRLTYSRGVAIPMSYANPAARRDANSQFYISRRSNNGEILVIACVPRTAVTAMARNFRNYWALGIFACVVCIFVAYITTALLTRNLTLLQRFAVQAASGQVDFDQTRFSHDELGDISREIVKLYNDKSKALANSTREHEMAMFAVEEKSRIKRQLTNNINHEIKTPVGVIRGYLDTLVNSPEMDDVIKRQFLSRAHTNVIRLCNLLNDVSTMTRLEESGANIPSTEINFQELAFSVQSDLTAAGVLENLEFILDVPLNCMIRGNNGLLTGILSNLIRNASQYSQGTEVGLKLINETPQFYTFSFYDNGKGVSEEHIPHLFERFYRVDAGRSRKAGGTGLGLPIVKNAIEAMGGSISVHNRSIGGLEFVFTLEKWSRVKKS